MIHFIEGGPFLKWGKLFIYSCAFLDKRGLVIRVELRIFDIKLNNMDLQSRKKAFLQRFLEIQNEDVISKLEQILKKEKNSNSEFVMNAMTKDELIERVKKSESDFDNGRFKSSEELLYKYDSDI